MSKQRMCKERIMGSNNGNEQERIVAELRARAAAEERREEAELAKVRAGLEEKARREEADLAAVRAGLEAKARREAEEMAELRARAADQARRREAEENARAEAEARLETARRRARAAEEVNREEAERRARIEAEEAGAAETPASGGTPLRWLLGALGGLCATAGGFLGAWSLYAALSGQAPAPAGETPLWQALLREPGVFLGSAFLLSGALGALLLAHALWGWKRRPRKAWVLLSLLALACLSLGAPLAVLFAA